MASAKIFLTFPVIFRLVFRLNDQNLRPEQCMNEAAKPSLREISRGMLEVVSMIINYDGTITFKWKMVADEYRQSEADEFEPDADSAPF